MRRLTTDELWTLIRTCGDEFFSVEFERRTNRPDGTASAGTIRKMLCRTGMNKYKLGVISDVQRDAEDFQHGILTVWDFGAYQSNIKRGMDKERAGFNAWRRIDVLTIRQCSLLDKYDLAAMGVDDTLTPPDIVQGVHQLTNQYRLANLPRTPLLVHP